MKKYHCIYGRKQHKNYWCIDLCVTVQFVCMIDGQRYAILWRKLDQVPEQNSDLSRTTGSPYQLRVEHNLPEVRLKPKLC